MIKNERQAAITRSRLSRLTALEAELQGRLSDCPDGDRMLLQLQLDAVLGEASAMRSDLEAYDELRLGRRPVAPPSASASDARGRRS